jgi:hypothetical protein
MNKQIQERKSIGVLRGFREAEPGASLLKSKSVSIKAEFKPAGTRAGKALDSIPVDSTDIIEVEFSDGCHLWMRADDYRERFLKSLSRGVEQTTFVVPSELDLLPKGMQSRGPVKWAVAAVKVLGIDLPEKAAEKIALKFDESHNKGLHRCLMKSGELELQSLMPEETRKMPVDRPYLLFIHGTASSTKGSFGDLWSEPRSPELAALMQFYDDRVLALEHGTLLKSPIENAFEIADILPEGARLHLVSHSRGGLVGELLCRGNRLLPATAKKNRTINAADFGLEPFMPDEIQLFNSDQWRCQMDPLKRLQSILKKKRFHIERFVRVACPALGTTLASGRLDRWLSVVGSIAGRLGKSAPLYDMFADIGDFAAAVIKERTDPSTMPGLAAQMPDSPVIKLVNWPGVSVSGDLTVIAGDIEPDAWWARLLVFVADRFYEGDHDLVVNTPSMFGGANRSGRALAATHKGPGINHFSYFSNFSSARRIVQALTSDSQEGFEELKKPVSPIARGNVAHAMGPLPVVFVLPGIMGSELAAGKDRVWIDIPDLVFGGIGKLRIDAANVVPIQVMNSNYGKMIEYLSQSHKVVPLPYDWRLPVEQEADRLAKTVRLEIKNAGRAGKPVRILAHSMGGMVARAMIAKHQDVWRDICADPGGRLIMLGTPNGGSHTITELLVGQGSALRRLDLIDMEHTQVKLLEIISRFPGLLALLPKDPQEDYFSVKVWRDYYSRVEAGGKKCWVIPAAEDLERARKFRRLLDASPIDPGHMIYVAGSADITISGMRYDAAEKRIEFLGTSRGDGRVTWDSGVPPGIPTYYMDVEHGDLPANEQGFPAIAELLEKGATGRLPQSPPVSRATDEVFPIPRAVEEFYPNEESLIAAATGAGARIRRTRRQYEPPIQVTVVHGNLAYANYPVAVGHYSGDAIFSAERYLDQMLDGALSHKFRLEQYPGPIESNAFIVNTKLREDREAKPQGAIIIGLGTPINLTASLLTRSFRKAILEYVSAWTQNRSLLGEPASDALNKIGLTTLLIGSGAGGVSLTDSLYSLLQAVISANRGLEAARQKERIYNIEIIELWEDVAIQAARSLLRLQQAPEMRGQFIFDGKLSSSKGGLRRVSNEESPNWWQRLQVLGGDDDADAGILRFMATTQRARNEVRLLPTQRLLVDRFIEEAIRTTSNDQAISRTLFELLLPNEIKEQAPDQDDLVLLLDEASARYPWEILEDPKSKDGPFAVRHGLIRQLASPVFREGVKNALSESALVVGDPASRFVELPYAQSEAQAVAQALELDGHFSVTSLVHPEDSRTVLKALFDRSYRLIHLAGHGVYQYTAPEAMKCRICGQLLEGSRCSKHGDRIMKQTGMVLGDGVFLTPMEIRQMREVPELVFINCCYLGRIEPGSEGEGNEHRDFNVIAANLSTEFIRMGVRAIVAAGWAVDDTAADVFARAFYAQMLSGECFGDAVRAARRATYDRHPRANTWGAYQCYGDPDYRLLKEGQAKRAERTEIFVSVEEVIGEINNVGSQLSTKTDGKIAWELNRLKELVEALKRNGWIKNGNANAALARAYGEAGCFEEACAFYRIVQQSDDSVLTIEDIEKFAKYQGKKPVIPGNNIEIKLSELRQLLSNAQRNTSRNKKKQIHRTQ